jgi:hypothetical protein
MHQPMVGVEPRDRLGHPTWQRQFDSTPNLVKLFARAGKLPVWVAEFPEIG